MAAHNLGQFHREMASDYIYRYDIIVTVIGAAAAATATVHVREEMAKNKWPAGR